MTHNRVLNKKQTIMSKQKSVSQQVWPQVWECEQRKQKLRIRRRLDGFEGGKKTPTSRKIAGWSRNKDTLDKRIPTDSKVQGKKEKKGLILAFPVPELMWVSCGGRRAQSLDFEISAQRWSRKATWQSWHCGSFGPGCHLLAKCSGAK